jgi:hypothetical protein
MLVDFKDDLNEMLVALERRGLVVLSAAKNVVDGEAKPVDDGMSPAMRPHSAIRPRGSGNDRHPTGDSQVARSQ